MKNNKFSRREFFQKSIDSVMEYISEVLTQYLNIFERFLKENNYILPPGVLHKTQFLQRCNGCGDCVKSCPYNSLRMYTVKKREHPLPLIDPKNKPCYLCEDFPCIASCTTRALTSDWRKMGIASIDSKSCYAFQGIYCISCVVQCPKNAIQLSNSLYPKISEEYCLGCGICVFVCPTSPKSIRIFSPI